MIKETIQLVNGIKYTKKQVQHMFDSQSVTTLKQVLPEDKKTLNKWLNESSENRE